MDVHRSRADCMLRLGDIFMRHGNLLKAVQLWETARPLFECSLQAKQVENVNERLASMNHNVLEHHRANSVCLAPLNVASISTEDVNNISDIQDIEELDLAGDKRLDIVAV